MNVNKKAYKENHENNLIIIKELEGKTLNDIYIHVVPREYNIVYFVFSDSKFCISGAIGSEILRISQIDAIDTNLDNLMIFKPYSVFINKTINQIRVIGEEWNGYGFEFSFNKIFDKTLIVQSIYTGDKPDGFEDCIRLGIGNYYFNAEEDEEYLNKHCLRD